MKKILFIILFLPNIFSEISAQINELGLIVGNNFSSHTNTDPTIPEDGQFQWNNLNGLNIGVYATRHLSTSWKIRSSINFQQKGYTEIAQTGIIGGPFQTILDNTLRNRLRYITLNIQGAYILNPKNENLQFSLFSGIENNILINRTLESEMVPIIADFYPVNEYQDNWNNYHLNYLMGLRSTIKESIGISAFFSRSLTPVLKTDRLIVKDWIWGISMDLNLLSILISK